MVAKERRRKRRHGVSGWTGRYRLEGATGWRDCRLVDISETGAGFEAFMLATDAVRLTIAELELVDPSPDAEATIRVRGKVSHLTRSQEGHVRVGIEFVGLTALEARLLGILFSREASRHGAQTLHAAAD
jgi:hypothetical protein